MSTKKKDPTPGILSLTIKDKTALYAAYMPFLDNGGLFVPTEAKYKMGDEVFILLTLLGNKEKLPVAGKVVWLTPEGAHRDRNPGIGVQFSKLDNGGTRNSIETILTGVLGSDRPTHTM